MNINYHYFTVKVLAVKAGFFEDDAQIIASYSQFVDDFDIYAPRFFSNVPDFARYLATKVPFGWMFYPVTTGFNSFFDYVRLSSETNQRRILIPFHFITQDPITVIKQDRREYRVKPVTTDGNSLLNNLLAGARNLYRQTANRENTIRIGALLHIFADTYSHQRFSGFWNWENHAYLFDAKDNRDDKNITSSYSPNKYYYAPSIGHPNVSTAPDDSYVSFTVNQKVEKDEKFPYEAYYSRNNTLEFLNASREILNYLRSCRNLGKIDDNAWNDLTDSLKRGLLTSDTDVKTLQTHWSGIFQDISFHYDKDNIYSQSIQLSASHQIDEGIGNVEAIRSLSDDSDALPGIVFDAVSDDFFHFNVIADAIRKAVDPSFTTDEFLAQYTQEISLKKTKPGKEIVI